MTVGRSVRLTLSEIRQEPASQTVRAGPAGRVQPQNEHEWDAAISVLPVVRRLQPLWRDLRALPTEPEERLVQPCGKTVYMWP